MPWFYDQYTNSRGENPEYQPQVLPRVSPYQQTSMNFQQYYEKNNLILEFTTKSGKYISLPMENKCVFEEYRETVHRKKNDYGETVRTQKQNATIIDICSFICIVNAVYYLNSDSSKENFYFVSYFSYRMGLMETATISESKYNSKTLYSAFNNLTPFANKANKTNELLRIMVENRVKANSIPKIHIPSRCGWNGDKEDPRFISCNGFSHIEPSALSYTILSYRLPQIDDIDFVCKDGKFDFDLRPLQIKMSNISGSYLKSWQSKFLFAIRAASLLLFLFEQAGIRPQQFLLPIISNTNQADYITSILKTHNPEDVSAISLNSGQSDIKKELFCTQDGIAVIKALLDIRTINSCSSNINVISNALNQAYSSDDEVTTRHFIAIIARSLFETEYNESILPIDCSCIESDIDNSALRSELRIFDANLIIYIDYFHNLMASYIAKNYQKYTDPSLSPERNSLLTIFKLSLDIFSTCFKIEFFSEAELEKIDEMFHCDIRDYKTNNQIATEEFSSIVSSMIENKELTVIDKDNVKSQFKPDSNILIYNRADRLLSFEPSLVEWLVTNKMTAVKSRDELINALRYLGKLRMIDHNGQHIRIPTEENPNNRPFFYSISVELFGNIIPESPQSENDNAFFLNAGELSDIFFLPLVWNNASAAGIVADDLRNKNLHTLITGNSGKGKSYKMCRLAEHYHSMGVKTIFIDISNSFSSERLQELQADMNDYQIIDVYKDGLPFDIFDLSAFDIPVEKKMYLQNVIESMSAKGLSPERKIELSSRLQEVISKKPARTSIDDIIDEDSKSRRYALKTILEQFQNVYDQYSCARISCNDYINAMNKINVISFGQITASDISVMVFSLIESIYQHRVKDHRIPIVLLADQMQRYDGLFLTNPLAKILNEGRNNNIIAIGSTLEYGGTGRKVSKIFSKANIQIFFQPTIDSLPRVKAALGKTISVDTIGNLDAHRCIVKAEFYNKKNKKNETTILLGDSHEGVDIQNIKRYNE